jgi:hypothetical protein
MGTYSSVPQQQPVVISQPGVAGQGQTTIIYSTPVQPYGYGPSPLLEVALVADIVADVAIIDAIYGGKKKIKIVKNKSKSKPKLKKNSK